MALTAEKFAPHEATGVRSRLRRLAPDGRPQRALAVAVFINTFGSGMIMTTMALYFTQVVGLSVGRYALGLFVGSSLGLIVGLFAGRAADRIGAREAQIVVLLNGAVGMICFLFVTQFWQFVLVSSLMSSVYAGTASSQAPLIRALGSANPAGLRAYLRSVTNLAIALGALAAGAAIAVGTRDAYHAVIAGRAVAFAACAAMMLRVPRLRPVPAPALASRWQALRDRPYLLATALNCLMSVHFAVPTVLFPLWIAEYTSAPRWMVSGVFLLNTGIVVCLQVRFGKGVVDYHAASRRMLWAGLAIAAGLSVTALSHGQGFWTATALLLAGMSIYTIGELWHSVASMEYQFGLAAPHAQGLYSGVFGIGSGVAQAVAPTVVAVLALHWAGPGLAGLGLCFLVVGAASEPLLTVMIRRWPPTTDGSK